MSDNESFTSSKLNEDYMHPPEKISKSIFDTPRHVVDSLSSENLESETTEQPEELSYEYDLPEGIEVPPETTMIEEEHYVEEVEVKTIPKEIDYFVTDTVDDKIDFDNAESDNITDEELDNKEEPIMQETPPTMENDFNPEDYEVPYESPEQKNDKIVYTMPKQKINIRWEPKFKDKKTDRVRNIYTELALPTVNYDELDVTTVNNNVNTSDFTSQSAQEFLAYIKLLSEHYQEYRNFDKSMTREGSDWDQIVESDTGPLALSRPNFGTQKGSNLTGEKAILKLNSIMNLGQLMSVPLWHSGIWLKLKAPSDAALLALENRIAEEKEMLGRSTNGFIFSNSQAYIYDYLVNLIMSCVYDSTFSKNDLDALKSHIKITDLTTLVWGFLCTIYPNGYPIAQPCLNNIGNCDHVEHEMVMISKLMWIDKSTLTATQIKHMSKRDKQVTLEDVTKYQEELLVGGDKLIKINDTLSIMLTVPTVKDYIDAGYRWVDEIDNMIADSFASAKTGPERNEYINIISKTMRMRQYSHWIKEIRFSEDAMDPETFYSITDTDTLEEALDNISKDFEVTTEIIVKINEYIDNSTMAVVGIPRYLCPVCKTDQGAHLPEGRYIIPLDIVRIFFTLQNQRSLMASLLMNE